MKKITIEGNTLTTRTSEIKRRGKRRHKHTPVAILTQINCEEIFRYFKISKKQTYPGKRFYHNVIVFKPGQDVFQKFKRHFTTEE